MIEELSLNRPVGERFEYSNLNSAVLGLIIERVTGRGWAEYVQDEILAPLRMTSTYTSKAEAESDGLTATHRMAFGFPIETEGEHLEGLAPTGFVYSTANDVARRAAITLFRCLVSSTHTSTYMSQKSEDRLVIFRFVIFAPFCHPRGEHGNVGQDECHLKQAPAAFGIERVAKRERLVGHDPGTPWRRATL